jgi:hypothetical protein
MRKFINKIKNSKIAKTLLVGLTVFALSMAVFTTANASRGPVFNDSEYDYPLIRVATVPADGNDFATQVTAEQGDVVAVMLYYHNNTLNTVAENTSLKVNLPTGEANSHTLNAELWADNTAKVAGSAVINTEKETTLTYVSGSTKWYPERNLRPNEAPVATPDGITANGINIGDVCGCWEYAGFVSFKVQLNEVEEPEDPEEPEEPVQPTKPDVDIDVDQEQTITGVTSLPKTGSPMTMFAGLSAVLSGLSVSGYYFAASKKELAQAMLRK